MPTQTTEPTTTFEPDDVVDIVIRGAQVDWHGDHTLTITIPGWPDPIEIPLVDQDGGPMPAVKITLGDTSTGTTSVPGGPDMTGRGRNLYSAVRAAIDEHGLPSVDAMGAGDGGRYLRLRDEHDRRAWAAALGFAGNDEGVWGDGRIRLLVPPADHAVLDGLDTLGHDYLADPAERILQVAAIAPEYVTRADEGGDQR